MKTLSFLLANWKTSLAGLATLGAGLTALANDLSTGDFSHLPVSIGMITAGFTGLVAKDFNVTNAAPSTQVPAAPVK